MFWRSRNQGGSSCGQGWTSCTTWDVTVPDPEVSTRITYLSSTRTKPTKLGNFLTAAGSHLPRSPPEARVPLLDRHNIQLQHRGPHQPLLTVEIRPTQGFMRQVPQAFHEGSITFVQTWDASTGKPIQECDEGRSSHWYNTEYYNVLHEFQTL